MPFGSGVLDPEGGASNIQQEWARTSAMNSAKHAGSANDGALEPRLTGHRLHILNHTVELIQFIWPGSRYGAITSLLTECGGGDTPECSGNGQSAQLISLQEESCGGGREGVLLFKDAGAKFD